MNKRFYVLGLKKIIFILLLIFISSPIFAKTSFQVYDIDSSNNLLYSAKLDFPGAAASASLFKIRLDKTHALGNPVPLTCVPEQMELLTENVVQLRNTFGTARYDMKNGKLVWILRNDDFPTGWYECSRQIESPDGKWICMQDSNGGLSLLQAATGIQVSISENCSASGGELVKWAEDSKVFLYEDGGGIYFASTDAGIKKLLPPASMRKIGKGTLNNVQWNKNNIYYADGDIVYKITEGELYTRGLYSSVTGCGNPVARLSNVFDSFHDKFFISPDEKYFLCVNANKTLNLYSVPKDFGFASVRKMESLIGLSGSILDVKVFWKTDGTPVLWIENLSYSNGKKSVSIYALDKSFSLLSTYENPADVKLSPDGNNLAFTYGKSLEIWNLDGWKLSGKSDGEKIYSFRWINSFSLIAGGENTLHTLVKKESSLQKTVLNLSSVKNAVWENGKIKAWCESDNSCYEYDEKKNIWTLTQKSAVPANKGYAANGKFRAYTSECSNEHFENAIFVRSLVSPPVTYDLILQTGEQIKKNGKVSIIFDAAEGNEGLAQVLSVLESLNMKATFFINGEFIRRYPMETCQIYASGNRCASGFFTVADLFSPEFEINADFIQRGLARNEDEFFIATGKELELLWHAPNFHSNEMIKNAGESAGYSYVDSWTEVNDRLSFEDVLKDKSKIYKSADEIISCITENLYDGMVIAVNVGNIKGNRSDYLYEKLLLLIRSILISGFDIVPLENLK